MYPVDKLVEMKETILMNSLVRFIFGVPGARTGMPRRCGFIKFFRRQYSIHFFFVFLLNLKIKLRCKFSVPEFYGSCFDFLNSAKYSNVRDDIYKKGPVLQKKATDLRHR